MEKSMYSIMLMDRVVREIDLMAQAQNTNRSNLINQILAEYVSLVTPEKRINDIFNSIDNMLSGNIFASYIEPYDSIMSLKSSLNYKYRPTIKYTVELYRNDLGCVGELKAIFRTQSSDLLYRLSDFFNLWIKMEQIYLNEYLNTTKIEYSFENGKFSRRFLIPKGKHYSNDELAKAISDYLKTFDEIIKDYLSNKYTSVREIENRYLSYLNSSTVI